MEKIQFEEELYTSETR